METTHTDYFSEEHRKKYLEECRLGLDAILNDALLGEDQNDIRSEFPKNCSRENVTVENTKVSLNYINGSTEPIIEAAIQIGFKTQLIGEYKCIYNKQGILEDEFFYLE